MKDFPNGFDPKTLLGQNVKRAISIVDSSKPVFSRENRTVELAIFSDEPQLHWVGSGLAYVKLSMEVGAINLERFNGGLALTENHDARIRLGRSRSPRTDGRFFRATARFSSRPYADEIFNEVIEDIEAGDTPNTSGIARIDEVAPQPVDMIDGIPVVLASKWTPLENCIATIGLDKKVGVGRAMGTDPICEDEDCEDPECTVHGTAKPGTTTRSATMTTPVTVTPPAAPPPSALDQMIERQAAYETFAVRFGATDDQKAELRRMASDFALGGKPEAELFAEIQRQITATKVPLAAPLTLTKKEQNEYSIARAIRTAAGMKPGGEDLGVKDTNCFEFEISQQLERSCPRVANAPIGDFRMPTNVPLRGLPKVGSIKRSGLDTATTNKGDELVYTEAGDSFIELLRNAAMCLKLGATTLTGLQGDVEFSGQTGAGTVTWVGENPGTDVADSDLSTDRPVKLSPKIAQSSTSYSRKLLAQSLYNIDNIVQNDMVRINSLEVDRVAIHGSGSAFQPKGIYQQTGVNAVAMGGAPTFDKIVDLETAIAAANADIGTMAYMTTPEIRGKCKKTAQLSNTIALPIWYNNELNGYRAEATNQISKVMNGSAATGGSSHGIVFGVWAFLLFGEWGALEMITDPYRLKKQGMIEITSYLMVDIALRYVASFSKGTGLTPT